MYQNRVELSMKGRDYRNLDQTSAISIVPTLVTNFMLSSTLFQYFHKAVFPSIRSAQLAIAYHHVLEPFAYIQIALSDMK